MKFFTADQHFGHTNIIKYCNRVNPETGEPFVDAEEMNDYLIRAWNAVVEKGDTVYHLGDLTKDSNPKEYLRKLNGRVVLIRGNHDYRKLPNLTKAKLLERVHDVLLLHSNKGSVNPDQRHPQVWLAHYSHRVWPASYHGSWHLYGHSHATLQDVGLSMDVGVDTRQHDYRPYSLPEIAERMKGRKTPKERNENE